jgi:hypothetical protein
MIASMERRRCSEELNPGPRKSGIYGSTGGRHTSLARDLFLLPSDNRRHHPRPKIVERMPKFGESVASEGVSEFSDS